jgi:hypothetical protein
MITQIQSKPHTQFSRKSVEQAYLDTGSCGISQLSPLAMTQPNMAGN